MPLMSAVKKTKETKGKNKEKQKAFLKIWLIFQVIWQPWLHVTTQLCYPYWMIALLCENTMSSVTMTVYKLT